MTESPGPIPIDYATPGAPASKPGRSIFGWALFIGLAIMLFVLLRERGSTAEMSMSDLASALEADKVRVLVVSADEIRGEFFTPAPGTLARFRVAMPQGGGAHMFQWIFEHRGGAEIRGDNQQGLGSILLPFIPWLLIFGFVWFFIFRQLRRQMPVR